jgi:hypothetical protein
MTTKVWMTDVAYHNVLVEDVAYHNVLVEVDLRVDGDSVILSRADARRLLNCIRWRLPRPVNGKVLLTVEAETILYSDVSKEDSNKHDTTDPTRT